MPYSNNLEITSQAGDNFGSIPSLEGFIEPSSFGGDIDIVGVDTSHELYKYAFRPKSPNLGGAKQPLIRRAQNHEQRPQAAA